MATSRKTDSIVAFRLQAGKASGGALVNNGWGDSDAIQTLGAGDLLSIIDFAPKVAPEIMEDDSVVGAAFKGLPVQGIKSASGSMGGNLRYRGMDKLLFWALGWERPGTGNSPMVNCQFTVSGVTVTPTAGATYTNNSSTFTVRGTNISDGAGTIYTTRTSGSNAPQSSGNLTKTGGTGDATIAFSATSGIYYSHLFELDARERHFAPYRSSPAEQTAADYDSDDRKCRMATVGRKRGPNDVRYPHTVCAKITISFTAGNQASKWSADWQAYDETRGDYSSANWTFASGHESSTYIIMPHQWQISIGTSGSLSDIAVSDFEITVTIPLQLIPDSESGQYFAEPVGEGKYEIEGKFTVSRHSVDTFHGYRDNFNSLIIRAIATSGADQFKILLPNIKVTEAETTDDDVPKIPCTLALGSQTNAANPFTWETEGHTIIQESPILIITNNQNSTNEMRRE